MNNSSCCGGKDMSCCEEEKTSSGMVIDVVCGMKIDSKGIKIHSEYKDKMYYFCNIDCKSKFESDPEKYIKSN
jgi:Cu+-exporting ATPase